MVIQIYIIHVLFYDTVKHCEGVNIVKKDTFSTIEQVVLFNINSSETTNNVNYIVLSESRLQLLNRFLCSSMNWSRYCFCSSFFVVLLNVCISATPRSALS